MDSIDFDEASKEWRKNKVKQPGGAFRYRCAHFSKTKQQFCKNKLKKRSDFCKYHYSQRRLAGVPFPQKN
jgi:hypothetical protein